MTLEELRSEANKLGYSVVKKRRKVYLKPCVCGCNKREIWNTHDLKYFYKCVHCGRKSPPADSLMAAKELWNEMMKELKNGEGV